MLRLIQLFFIRSVRSSLCLIPRHDFCLNINTHPGQPRSASCGESCGTLRCRMCGCCTPDVESEMGNMVLSFAEAFSDSPQGTAEAATGIPRITLRQLVYFAAAAENQSALRAAEELNVSPPAISGAISCLEAILGEQLFVRRHARGLLLTEAGHHLLMEA